MIDAVFNKKSLCQFFVVDKARQLNGQVGENDFGISISLYVV